MRAGGGSPAAHAEGGSAFRREGSSPRCAIWDAPAEDQDKHLCCGMTGAETNLTPRSAATRVRTAQRRARSSLSQSVALAASESRHMGPVQPQDSPRPLHNSSNQFRVGQSSLNSGRNEPKTVSAAQSVGAVGPKSVETIGMLAEATKVLVERSADAAETDPKQVETATNLVESTPTSAQTHPKPASCVAYGAPRRRCTRRLALEALVTAMRMRVVVGWSPKVENLRLLPPTPRGRSRV